MIMTGIGSRNITPVERDSIINFAQYSAAGGVILRSGKASGADEAFQLGYQQTTDTPVKCEIYIPWAGFHNPYLTSAFDIDSSKLGTWSEAQKIACRIHPAPNRLKPAALSLHTRNVHQVLGQFLIDPSDFCIFCADEDSKGKVLGGTATAVNLCIELGIPTYNIRTNRGDNRVRELWQSSFSRTTTHYNRLINGWESNSPLC